MALGNGVEPSKVIAVHLNFRSCAEERGRVPTAPSYFFKPPSSVSDGDVVVRPQGVQLLTFEGEIAVIIGERARGVSPEEADRYIGFYAPANDFGASDFRWADRGSNVLSKGHDGFTPIGPLVPAAEIDPSALHLRTLLNGEVVQDGISDELIFPFRQLIADLSRFMTLEPGDVILTGTLAGAGVVGPGDVVEVQLEGLSSVRSTVVDADGPLQPFGAMPRIPSEGRDGVPSTSRRCPEHVLDDLRSVSTATLTTQLAKRGIDNVFLTGLVPTRPDLRMVGYARTVRYVATRGDLRDAHRRAEDAQKRAVESIRTGEVLVIEARGDTTAGTIGDILAARILALGGAGIVTDGGVRDTSSVTALQLPTYLKAANASSLWVAHIPLETAVPVTCAGVLIMPGDLMVGDGDGVVVVPAAVAEEVARDAIEQESRESWALERVTAGESIKGVYPLSQAREAEYEQWRRAPEREPAGEQ